MPQTVYAVYMGGGRLEARGGFDFESLDRHYRIGQTVRLEITDTEPNKQHQAFFMWLREIYDSLPSDCPEPFRNQDHLRAWMLYKTGFCHTWSHPRNQIDNTAIRIIRQMTKRTLYFEYTDTHIYIFEPYSFTDDDMHDREKFSQFWEGAKGLAEALIPGIDLQALEQRRSKRRWPKK